MGKQLPLFNHELLRRFRDQFNTGDFGYLHYRSRNGNDDFSAICSAMDWIEVAVDFLNCFRISRNRDNKMSMDILTLIMAVDIIYSCITTMHRVIFNKPDKTPFFKSTDVFGLDISDNDHFKNLRAAFGIHPTDLTIVKGEKRYSSWSVVSHDERYDFAVWLYSSIPDKKAELYGFNIDELIRFAQTRYEYLEELTEELKKQYFDILKALKEKQIRKSDDLKERLKILKEAAEERHGRDQYFFALEEVETMLNAPCSFIENESVVQDYKQLLLQALDNIENNLQQMEFEQMPALDIIHPKYRPNNNTDSYIIGKIYEELSGMSSIGMMDYHLERIAHYLRGIEKISPTLRSDELLLLVNAGLYFAGVNNKE